MQNNIKQGLKDGIPIALGYFSVSFTFGMKAIACGLTAWQAGLISLTNLTSAGQFAGLTIIAAGSSLTEMALTQLVINLRYALMSLSLSQKLSARVTPLQRCIIAYGNTDEIFAVASNKQGSVGLLYMLGLAFGPIIGWVSGTLVGAIAGDVLPLVLQSALGIAIYGMFVAIVVPPMRKSQPVCAVVAIALVAWVGVSVYHGLQSEDTTTAEKPSYTVNTSSLDEFITGLNTDDAE